MFMMILWVIDTYGRSLRYHIKRNANLFLILSLWIARRLIRTRGELKQRKPGVDFNGDNDFQTEIPA
ncbi:hypothetical protein HanRHA438_Chr08g0365211 [Helianthus annuus]|nr:hypothetical protein HanRHA438_Chr08g0365211 [Helianthus annuus]